MTDTPSIERLRKTLSTTSSSRFEAARRLMGHYRVSQWVISIVSAALIILPLIDVLAGGITPSGVLQTALAIILLVYSTLLSSENFYYKSKEFYRCGLELEKLIGKIDTQEVDSYKEADSYYRIILDEFENHETVDYERAWYNRNKWNMGFLRKNSAGFLTRIKLLAGYVYYAPFVILLYLLYKYIQ